MSRSKPILRSILINPYSVLTPPGGFIFNKILHFRNIFLVIFCRIRKYLLLYENASNMYDAVRVK